MKLSLKICFSPAKLRDPVAWLIPGNQPEWWIRELLRWEIPLAEVRLWPLPVHEHEQDSGLFVMPARSEFPAVSPIGCGYGIIGRRLFLPVNADIWPPIEDAELYERLPDEERLYLWHPTAGLLTFSTDETIGAAGLLAIPGREDSHWDRAVPGLTIITRMVSLALESPPDANEILQEVRGDIGSKSGDLGELPRGEGEPLGGTLGAALRSLAAIGAAAAYGITKLISWIPGCAIPGRGLANWAREQLERIGRSNWLERNKEISRLLDLLATDPDAGLKFALPIGALPFRGVGAAGNRLIQRKVDFDMRRLGGSRRADLWDIEADYRRKLSAQYRQLANREIRLGRYRRAAYIFAELLGDLSSAAATLADGKHWREAAALYADRLHQPRSAAQCMERGGLWTEAITIYEKLEDYEKVGDLYRQIEQEDQAVVAYRQAAAVRTAANDYLGASALLEQKLHAPDEAWEQLIAALPNSRQARNCLGESFRLLARNAQHDRALMHVQNLSAMAADRASVQIIAEGLSDAAITYPDEAVRDAAADQTRRIAASRLEMANQAETATLTAAVTHLVPADLLLARDAKRFVAGRREKPIVKKPLHRPNNNLQVLDIRQLPAGRWCAAVNSGAHFYIAGYRNDRLSMLRGSLTGPTWPMHESAAKSGRIAKIPDGSPLILAADPYGNRPVVVHVLQRTPLPAHVFLFPADDESNEPVWAGGHASITSATHAVQFSRHGNLCCVDQSSEGELVVNTYSPTNQLLSSSILVQREVLIGLETITFPLPFFVADSAPCLGLGGQLWTFGIDGRPKSVDYGSTVFSITGSLPHTRSRVAVSLDRGGILYWAGAELSNGTTFADDLIQPHIGLNRGGWLIAANERAVQVYSTQGGKLSFHAHCPGPDGDIIAVLSTRIADQFALVTAQGIVLRYQIPPDLRPLAVL